LEGRDIKGFEPEKKIICPQRRGSERIKFAGGKANGDALRNFGSIIGNFAEATRPSWDFPTTKKVAAARKKEEGQ